MAPPSIPLEKKQSPHPQIIKVQWDLAAGVWPNHCRNIPKI